MESLRQTQTDSLPVVRDRYNVRRHNRRQIALRRWDMKSFVLAVDIVLFADGNYVAPIFANIDTVLRRQHTNSDAAHLKIVST